MNLAKDSLIPRFSGSIKRSQAEGTSDESRFIFGKEDSGGLGDELEGVKVGGWKSVSR